MNQIPAWLVVLVSAFTGTLFGSALTWLVSRTKLKSAIQSLTTTQVDLARCSAQLTSKDEELQRTRKDLTDLKETHETTQQENLKLNARVAVLDTTVTKQREHEAEKLQLLDDARGKLSDAFKTLANEILETRAAKLEEVNESQIGSLLNPLQEKLKEFNDTVQNVHHEQGKEQASLRTELGHLKELNQSLSQDAQNLAIALKGSTKTQGNWGEMILDRILEASGLHKGRDYELRPTYHYEDGRRGQPDVIIKLPEGRHVIVDSKVSLVDYDIYVNSKDDIEAESAADRHVDSVRRHMKELAEKNYQDLYGLNSLDFVVMFVPIEPAFAAAIRLDNTLWENAFRRNVLIVSPSGLLFVLRTVAVLWRQESQARNVRDIAKKGADLYNKLVGFVEELDTIGLRLRQAQESFDDARKKLCTGQGNVIRQAEMLKELGIKPNKTLPADLIESSAETPSPVPPLVALAQDQEIESEIAAMAASSEISDEEIPF